MGNVLQLFEQPRTDHSHTLLGLKNAIATLMAADLQLACAIEVISLELETLDRLLDELADPEDLAQLRQMAEEAREQLRRASCELHQQRELSSSLRRKLAEIAVPARPGQSRM